MNKRDKIKALIQNAFADARYPGDGHLRNSDEGNEPYLLERDFKGRSDWRTLDAAFLDQAPDRYGTALSFFSNEAFRFYLPAYLLADLDGLLEQQDPVYHLTHGLTDSERNQCINPGRYGQETWFDYASTRFSIFNEKEVAAIVEYLGYKLRHAEFDRPRIDEALSNYWTVRLRR